MSTLHHYYIDVFSLHCLTQVYSASELNYGTPSDITDLVLDQLSPWHTDKSRKEECYRSQPSRASISEWILLRRWLTSWLAVALHKPGNLRCRISGTPLIVISFILVIANIKKLEIGRCYFNHLSSAQSWLLYGTQDVSGTNHKTIAPTGLATNPSVWA